MEPIPHEHVHYQVYKRRWLVLFLYALLGIHTNVVYSTFSPIAPTAEIALGLNQGDIGLLANWFYIMICVGIFPMMWLVQVKGLRLPVVLSAMFIAIGSWIRCLTTYGLYPAFDKAMLHLGQVVNGLAISALWCGCTKLSAVWFPSEERTMATSIGLLSSGFGVAVSFLVGPYTVDGLAKSFAYDENEPTKEDYAKAIHYLNYGIAIVAQILLLVTVLYFPSAPPKPPCYTATSQRISFVKGIKEFAKSRDGWLLLVLYSISGQVYYSYTQFLSLELSSIMSDIESGWLGFAISTALVISGPILGLTTFVD